MPPQQAADFRRLRPRRNVDGRVIMYGDQVTRSMRACIDETERRRAAQLPDNAEMLQAAAELEFEKAA